MSAVVARSLEDDHGDVADLPTERLGDPVDVVGRARRDVDVPGGDRSDAQLLEVGIRRVEQPAPLGGREDGDRAGLAVGDEVGALERVDRDVDLRADAPIVVVLAADLLADVEHRRLVPLAFADDDRPRHVDLVHRPAHRLGRGPVRLRAGRPGP